MNFRRLITGAVCGLLAVTRLPASVPAASDAPGPPATGRTSAPFRNLGPRGADEEFNTGFVFKDGAYLPPPYVVRGEDGALVAGGQTIAFPWGAFARRSGRPAEQVKGLLRAGAVFFVEADRPLMVLPLRPTGAALLRLLVPGHDRNAAASTLLRGASPEVRASLWGEWLLTFAPSPEFLTRAGEALRGEAEWEVARAARWVARERLAVVEFPLTVAVLLLVAMAAAHLLQNVPRAGVESGASEMTPAAFRALARTLVFLGLLAGADAAWTLLTAQAGQMRELNPLAAPLLGRPAQLLTFKVVLTLFAMGLILALRRHRAAHLGAWWMCFVTAAVAARWVLFSADR